MKMLHLTVMAVLLLSVSAACAGPLEEGEAAYQRGDYATAITWYRLSADQGDASAQFDLGLLYAMGRGIPRDDIEAAKWYRLAATQGHPDAQSYLGWMYAEGQGVVRNYAEAAKWYRLASAQGDGDALYYLGVMYAKGLGVAKDGAAAAKLYRLAATKHAPGPVPAWWPCPNDGSPTPEIANLVNQMLPGLADADREFHFSPEASRNMLDRMVCDAEADPKYAAEIARAWGYASDWTKADRKQAAAVAALQHRKAATTNPISTPAPWYTYNKNHTACFQGHSPAERIADIQGSGRTARTEDYGTPQALTKVDVIEDNDDGTETVYTYWALLEDCEAELPKNQPIPSRYR